MEIKRGASQDTGRWIFGDLPFYLAETYLFSELNMKLNMHNIHSQKIHYVEQLCCCLWRFCPHRLRSGSALRSASRRVQRRVAVGDMTWARFFFFCIFQLTKPRLAVSFRRRETTRSLFLLAHIVLDIFEYVL